MDAMHTPGPWHSFDESGYSWVGVAVHGSTGFHEIAKVYGFNIDRDRPNARLIAAAPDLLAALEECEDYFANREDVVDGDDGVPVANDAMVMLRVISAALARAKGGAA